MARTLIQIALSFLVLHSFAQDRFDLGKVSLQELLMTTYDRDTSAAAVVLDEFASATVGGEGYNRIHIEYYKKVKILRTEGLEEGNIQIPLRKSENVSEKLLELEASAYNLQNSAVTSSPAGSDHKFKETYEHFDLVKLAIPNVKAGSIIEVYYRIESPYMQNFWPWEFQSDIPKVKSEFWAKIPANYTYNITLRGFLKLSKNEQKIEKQCISSGSGIHQNYAADCIQYKFGMTNIPAFIDEDYMTTRKNFIAAIRFELSEIKGFDGRINKYTKEWKDAVEELKKYEGFGLQLKRAKDIERKAAELTLGENDKLAKAKKIYRFVQEWYAWNEERDFVCDVGVKKAFETQQGNVADINLSLVAALRSIGLESHPLLLSTRSHGAITELHPVLTEFDYILAMVKIDDKTYLLDGTNDWLPFGMIPIKCLNGKGRVFEDKESYWVDLNTGEKEKKVTYMDITLESDGHFKGKMVHTYTGYSAYTKRSEIAAFDSEEKYIEDLNNNSKTVQITDYKIEGMDNLETDVRESFEVDIEGFDDMGGQALIFNPFFSNRLKQNPFRSSNRMYPVDFATPIESVYVISLTLPSEYEVTDLPKTTALALPGNGGKFLFDVNSLGDRLTFNYQLTINRTIFSANEYFSLKELFNRILEVQNFDLLCKKKS